MITTQEIIDKMRYALKGFGEYTFEDKGPDEVMSTEPISNALSKMSAIEAGKILKEVSETDSFGHSLAETLVIELQDTEEDWFEEVLEISGVEF